MSKLDFIRNWESAVWFVDVEKSHEVLAHLNTIKSIWFMKYYLVKVGRIYKDKSYLADWNDGIA